MSYYKLVKDLVEKISKNSSSSTRFILLIFSTRYFNSNINIGVQLKLCEKQILLLCSKVKEGGLYSSIECCRDDVVNLLRKYLEC